jgi:hypothetical protein
MAVVGFTKLQEIFRKGASLDIHKGHAKDVTDIVEQKLYDMLVIAQKNAKYNGRDVIWVADMPITKGFEETIDAFKKLEEEVNAQDVAEMLTFYPPLLTLEAELESRLPEIAGALLLTLAKTMKAIDPSDRAVDHELINKAHEVLNITM